MNKLLKFLLTITLLATNAYALTPIFQDDLDTGIPNPKWDYTFLSSSYTSGRQPFVTTPHYGTTGKSGQYYAKQGTNELTPWQLGLGLTQLQSITGKPKIEKIAIEWQENFDNTYPFPTSSQKLFRIGFDDEAAPNSKKEIGVLLQAVNTDLNVQYFCGLWGNPPNNSLCNVQGILSTNQGIPKSQWVKLVIAIKLNTPGMADGYLRLYKNDIKVASQESMNLRGIDFNGFNFMWIGGNYSNLLGANLPSSGSRYIDNIKIYDDDPYSSTPPPTTSTTLQTTTTSTSSSSTTVTVPPTTTTTLVDKLEEYKACIMECSKPHFQLNQFNNVTTTDSFNPDDFFPSIDPNYLPGVAHHNVIFEDESQVCYLDSLGEYKCVRKEGASENEKKKKHKKSK